MIKIFIEEKLYGLYGDFLQYCKESGKNFVEELDAEDFVAYRAEYSVPREKVEQLKKLLDFKNKKPVENIPAPKNISNELESSLQNYFKVADLELYKNILITDLDFNNRVQRCLKRGGYQTLEQLLKSSWKKIFSLRNFGQYSFENLRKTLEKFLAPHKKVVMQKVSHIADTEIDRDLCNAALHNFPQIDSIITAFDKFSLSVNTKSLFQNLSDEIKNKRVNLFLRIYDFAEIKFFPENLTFAELPSYIAENSLTLDVTKLKNFVQSFIDFDVKACAKQIAISNFKNKRSLEVIRRRAEGQKLEEIGKDFGLTRERVRQIESKAINNFLHHRADLKKILQFVYVMTDGKNFITIDDAKNFIDEDDVQIIWLFAAKSEVQLENFHFDKELDAFVFGDKSDFDINEILKILPNVMEEKIFDETIEKLARDENVSAEFLKLKFANFYQRSGKFFHRGRLTMHFKFEYILKERFPNGYKIADEMSYSRFIRYLQEIFDEKKQFIQHNIDSKIGTIGVLCERGKYIHADFVHVPNEIIERVKNFIDSSDRTAIFYKEIFTTLKDYFVGTQITNHYFLQGVIKFYGLPYILRKDYLTKSDEITTDREFENFVAERGEVSAQEIKATFVSFNDHNINFLMTRCLEVIYIGNGKYMHSSRLAVQDYEVDRIKNFLNQNCSTPVNSRTLIDLFFEKFSDFMTRNEIYNHEKLFGILQYLFRYDFNFSRPYISTTNIKNISNKKVLLKILEGVNEIEIEDILSICEDNEIRVVAKTALIESLHPIFIRVDEWTLARPESIGVNDEIIFAVVENIQSAIERNGGWQSVQLFDDYEWLPQLEISWNSFLLESVASLAGDVLHKLKMPATSANFSTAIFVADEFAEDNFESFVLKILTDEHNKMPFHNEKEIFDWLKAQGLCVKKLPRFLENGRALNLLSEY